MEVLKTGTRNVCTCGKCGSQLRWAEGDVKLEFQPDKSFGPYEMDIEPEDFYNSYVVCPVCPGTKIYVSAGRSAKTALIKAERDRDLHY